MRRAYIIAIPTISEGESKHLPYSLSLSWLVQEIMNKMQQVSMIKGVVGRFFGQIEVVLIMDKSKL